MIATIKAEWRKSRLRPAFLIAAGVIAGVTILVYAANWYLALHPLATRTGDRAIVSLATLYPDQFVNNVMGAAFPIGAAMAIVVLGVTACGTSNQASGKIGGTVHILGTWTGVEKDAFDAVMKPFTDQTGIKISFEATRDLDAILQNPAYAGYSGLGENILHGGCGISAAQMDQAWMNSPDHRANILGDFSAVGIGVACNGGDLYATEDFGR